MKASEHISKGGEVNSMVATRLFGERMNGLQPSRRRSVEHEIKAMVKAGLPVTIGDCAEMARGEQ